MSKLVEIKMSTVVSVTVILQSADLKKIEAALEDVTGGESDFFESEFAVLDVSRLAAGAVVSWPGVVALLKRFRLNPVAVRHAPDSMVAAIEAAGLYLDNGGDVRDVAIPVHEAARAPEPAFVAESAAPWLEAMVHDTPVRAGQRVYAQGRDLIVTAMVNAGGEVIADGNIFVYAPLRGRALAGAQGRTDARIFAMDLEAELVSIAGIYRTFEDGYPDKLGKQPCQVQLHGNKLEFLKLSSAV